MTRPSFLNRLRADLDAARQLGDPVDRIQDGHVIRLTSDQQDVWDEGAEWCREHLDHQQEQWSRRIDTGIYRDARPAAPAFTFSSMARAVAFRMYFY